MGVRFGMAIVSTDIGAYIKQVRRLDDAGVAMIGCGDSQALYHEQFIRCALAAEHSQQARVGTWITNPMTRHPAVTAAAITTVDDIAPGRAFLGVGTGDSTVYNAGLRPARLETLERFIHTIRALHQEGTSAWQGKPCHLAWAKRRIPIGMAVSGPRALRLAGQLADIVWVCFGLQDDQIAQAKQYLQEGAEAAGRTLDDIDLWWVSQFNVADSREAALDPIKPFLASLGHIMFRFSLDGKAVAPEVEQQVQELARRYQPIRHFDNVGLTDELELTDYLADRFAVAGPVETCIEQIRHLETQGVNQLFFYTALPEADKDRLFSHLADEIIPATR
ncbi:MAG: LLM class flavin-dependent oxidoreductase [Candidatus Tectomicrobia bacterium]